MKRPSNNKIKTFLEYLNGLEVLMWTHSGDQQPDPDLVEVSGWLKELSLQPKDSADITCPKCLGNDLKPYSFECNECATIFNC